MRSPSFLTKAIKISVICVGLGFSGKALAEYYVVYPDSMVGTVCCYSSCMPRCGAVSTSNYYTQKYPTPFYEMHFKSPRAHSERGSGEMAEYAWIPTP